MDPKFHIAYINLALLNTIENNTADALEHISQAEAMTSSCPIYFILKDSALFKKMMSNPPFDAFNKPSNYCPVKVYFTLLLGIYFITNIKLSLRQPIGKNQKTPLNIFIGYNNDIEQNILIKFRLIIGYHQNFYRYANHDGF